jgi:hypothetical protein
MREHWPVQTISRAFSEICQGEFPWVAVGNFMNEWYDDQRDARASLVVDPPLVQDTPPLTIFRWAVFCAAAVEWLCEQNAIACPKWVNDPTLRLTSPWFDFDSPGSNKQHVRQRLLRDTPAPFARRNIYCGNRVFANKYEFAAQRPQSKA